MAAQNRRIPRAYEPGSTPNQFAMAMARRQVATRRAQMLQSVVAAAASGARVATDESAVAGLGSGLVCGPGTKISPRESGRTAVDSSDDEYTDEEEEAGGEGGGGGGGGGGGRGGGEGDDPVPRISSADFSVSDSTEAKMPAARKPAGSSDEDEDGSRDGRHRNKKKKKRKKNKKNKKDKDRDDIRPVRSDVTVDMDLARLSLEDAAAAADAQIGRQMYAQQAYTTQTVFAEVKKQKQDFDQFIDNLVALLKMKANVLRLKLQSYRKRFAMIETIIFYGSVTIALITGFRVMFAAFKGDTQALESYNDALTPELTTTTTTTAEVSPPPPTTTSAADIAQDVLNSIVSSLTPAEILAFDLTVFLLSTAIGAISNTAGKRGWSKKSDAMATAYQQVQMVINSLPDSQMQIKFVVLPEEMHLLRTSFMTQQFKLYTDAVREMSNHLSFQTLTNHLPDQYDLNIRHLEDDHAYQQRLLQIFISQQGNLKRLASSTK